MQLEAIEVRFTAWWIIALGSVVVCGVPGIFVAWFVLGLDGQKVVLPFTPRCFKTWSRVRLASRLALIVALSLPYAGAIAGPVLPPDFFVKACGTALVLLVFPALLRFGPALLGPVFGGTRGGTFGEMPTILVHLPSEEAAAALEREGWD